MKKELLIFLILLIDITIISIALIFINATKKKEKKKEIRVEPPTIPSNTNSFNPPKRAEVVLNPLDKASTNYKDFYEPKWLLTYNEKDAFKLIYKVALDKGYFVFTKVRLLDLIQPRKHQNQKYLWKIQAKHVDFVICNEKLVARWIIELQDSSHKTPNRVERDLFVLDILNACGYKVLQTYSVTAEIINDFLKKDNEQLKIKSFS